MSHPTSFPLLPHPFCPLPAARTQTDTGPSHLPPPSLPSAATSVLYLTLSRLASQSVGTGSLGEHRRGAAAGGRGQMQEGAQERPSGPCVGLSLLAKWG